MPVKIKIVNKSSNIPPLVKGTDYKSITSFLASNPVGPVDHKEQNSIRLCIDCNKTPIGNNEPLWKTKCIDCFRKNVKVTKNTSDDVSVDKKACIVCNKKVLELNDWRDKCLSCYKTQISNEGISCCNCNKVFIPKFPSSKMCYPCYKNQKSG